MRDADRQVGEVQHTFTTLGIPLVDNSLSCKAPMTKLSPVPSCSDLADMDDLSGSCSSSLLESPHNE